MNQIANNAMVILIVSESKCSDLFFFLCSIAPNKYRNFIPPLYYTEMPATPDKIILGIDPGTTIMGYGLIRLKGSSMELITLGVLHLDKLNGHALKLKRIFEKTLSLIDEYNPDDLAIEAPFFGKNIQSMLKLGR